MQMCGIEPHGISQQFYRLPPRRTGLHLQLRGKVIYLIQTFTSLKFRLRTQSIKALKSLCEAQYITLFTRSP